MASFKACVYANHLRKDGMYNIKLRVFHGGKTRRLSTPYDVEAKFVNKKLEILDQEILNDCEDLCYQCRKICRELGFALDRMTVDEVVSFIYAKLCGDIGFHLDFCQYWHKQIAMKVEGTRRCHVAALNAFTRFIGKGSFDIMQITSKLVSDFKVFLEHEPSQRGSNRKIARRKGVEKKTRGVTMYIACMRAAYNRAKLEYNDEDAGIVPISRTPFARVKLVEPIPKKRAVVPDTLQRIIDLPYKSEKEPGYLRYNLAKDCFLLSFGLAGMNSVDLYTCGKSRSQGILIYNRQKTRRRADQAEMRIRIEPMIEPIVEKYKDFDSVHQFRFHRLYANFDGFNKAINFGLQKIATDLNLPTLQLYAARHTWATVGRSRQLNIEKAIIHEGLNHVDPAMKITDMYIEKDWSVIWDANLKILQLFSWLNG